MYCCKDVLYSIVHFKIRHNEHFMIASIRKARRGTKWCMSFSNDEERQVVLDKLTEEMGLS